LRVDVLTILPEAFSGPFSGGMVRQAVSRGLLELFVHDLRDYCDDLHRTTDDYVYGGGPGMVLKPEPIFRAVEHIGDTRSRVILLTPQGKPFTQQLAWELSQEEHMLFICGRYEGVDERVRQKLVSDELSIGDFVLTGGELPAMVIIDAAVRLIPGVLRSDVPRDDSFASGLLEGPQYTRPAEYRGLRVPEVLLSGHHERIARWRRKQSLRVTLERRPELLNRVTLSSEDRALLEDIRREAAVGNRRSGED